MKTREMDRPRLSFRHGFDSDDALETEKRGVFYDAIVVLPSGSRYSVCFYEPGRLHQDLERGQKSGEVCIAEPGLIIIPVVTLKYMQEAVNQLFDKKFFENLVPFQEETTA